MFQDLSYLQFHRDSSKCVFTLLILLLYHHLNFYMFFSFVLQFSLHASLPKFLIIISNYSLTQSEIPMVEEKICPSKSTCISNSGGRILYGGSK